jgi:hypothetical protein
MDDLMNPIIVAMDNDEPVDVIREIVDDSPGAGTTTGTFLSTTPVAKSEPTVWRTSCAC